MCRATIGMQAYEHDAADIMGERSESLQPMKIIWSMLLCLQNAEKRVFSMCIDGNVAYCLESKGQADGE